MAHTKPILRFQTLVVLLAVLLILLSACSASTDESGNAMSGDNTVTNTEANSPDNTSQSGTADQSSSEPGSDEETPQQAQPIPTDATPAAIPVDDSALTQLLLTDYTLVDNQVVPTSSWLCTDVFDQNRALYFFSEGVLDATRRVSIERTLYDNNTFDDIAFFWSVSASDAIVMSSATISESTGALLSTGQQYDVTGIRFFEVESRFSFTANSVLRGQITCAIFDIR